MSRDHPDMSEGIRQRADPVAPILIRHRLHLFRARGNRAFEHGVRVLDVNIKMHRRAAQRLRTARPALRHPLRRVLRTVVREPHYRIADLQYRVINLPVRLRHAFQLRRAERIAIELDRARRVIDAQERSHAMPTLGNRLHLASHDFSPRCYFRFFGGTSFSGVPTNHTCPYGSSIPPHRSPQSLSSTSSIIFAPAATARRTTSSTSAT